jgi:hypothetical protein
MKTTQKWTRRIFLGLALLTALLGLIGCGSGGGVGTPDPTPTPIPTPTPTPNTTGAPPPGVSHDWLTAPTTLDVGIASVGFVFTPKVNVTITELGYYDHNGDGLAIDHPVTLFNSTGTTRLAETTVRAGTVDTLRGKFRYRSITPITLTAGTTYVLAGYHNASSGDVEGYGNFSSTITGYVTDSRLNIVSGAARYVYYAGGTPLPFPANTYVYDLYMGPSLFIP